MRLERRGDMIGGTGSLAGGLELAEETEQKGVVPWRRTAVRLYIRGDCDGGFKAGLLVNAFLLFNPKK